MDSTYATNALCTTHTHTNTWYMWNEMKWKRDDVEAPWHPTMSDLCVYLFHFWRQYSFRLHFLVLNLVPVCVFCMNKLLDICVIFVMPVSRFNFHVVSNILHSDFGYINCILEFYVLRSDDATMTLIQCILHTLRLWMYSNRLSEEYLYLKTAQAPMKKCFFFES